MFTDMFLYLVCKIVSFFMVGIVLWTNSLLYFLKQKFNETIMYMVGILALV